METIERRKLPTTIRTQLGRKRSVFFTVTDKPVECTGTMWSGGSRSTWHKLSKFGGRMHIPDYVEGEERELAFGVKQYQAVPTPGYLLVELGTFCGKPATPHIYIHPEDADEILQR